MFLISLMDQSTNSFVVLSLYFTITVVLPPTIPQYRDIPIKGNKVVSNLLYYNKHLFQTKIVRTTKQVPLLLSS